MQQLWVDIFLQVSGWHSTFLLAFYETQDFRMDEQAVGEPSIEFRSYRITNVA